MTVLLIILAIVIALVFAILLLALRGRVVTHPINYNRVIKGAEKWTVTVSRYGYEDSIMDEFYLYTLNFIYGDREQKEEYGLTSPAFTRQNVGSGKHCKIQFAGDGVGAVHGFIRYEQDWGLTYTDNTMTKRTFFHPSKPKTANVYPACVFAPYKKAGYKTVKFIGITDNLKLFIGDCVLLFKKSIINECEDVYEEGLREDYEDNTEEVEFSLFESLCKGIMNVVDKCSLWIYNEYVCIKRALSRFKTSLKDKITKKVGK